MPSKHDPGGPNLPSKFGPSRTNIAREGPFLFGKNCLGGLILPSKFGPGTKIVRTKSVLGPNLTRTISAVTGPLRGLDGALTGP